MNYLDEAGKWLGLPEEESINEDAGSMVILAFFALLFGPDIYEKIKNIKTDTSYVVSDEEIDKIPDYGDKNEKIALSSYAYYKLGINNAEKNTLIYNSNTNINKNVYLYKFNKSKIKLIYNGPFDKLCKKYGIKMKPMNETKLKDREKVYKQTLSLVKQELNKYKELKAKADFESGKENYNNFINGLDNYITIFYCEVWDVAPRPRSNDPEDVEYTNKVAYEPIQNIINTVNSKLPKDYKLDSWGDWDDLDLTLFYNGKMSESYIPKTGAVNMNTIRNLASIAENYNIKNSNRLREDIVTEYTDIIDSLSFIDKSVINKDISLLPIYNTNEGYAIDLSSLKYVVESEECTLEDAIQKIRDVNYIGDTYPMYCILPEDINENMSLESFITLNHSLTESGIIPAVINEKSLNRKDWKEVGKEYKYSDRFRFKQTFQVLTDVDTIKNMFDDPTKTGNFEKIRPRLLRLVAKSKTLDDVNYLKRDARAAKVQLTKLKQNRPNIAKQIDAHIKWIETDYMNALNDKAKEIKSKK